MMISEPRAMKEIHDIREKIYEEIKHLSTDELAEQLNRKGREVAEKYGLKIRQKV